MADSKEKFEPFDFYRTGMELTLLTIIKEAEQESDAKTTSKFTKI